MAIEITIPRLGWSMEEGTFGSWLKQPGERVQAGEPLFAVESDKVTMDVESLDSGILYLAPEAPEAGAVVTVGQLIGYLLADGEAAPSGTTVAPSKTVQALPEVAAPVSPVMPTQRSSTSVPVTPRARRAARELGIEVRGVDGTGRGGRIRERDVRSAAEMRGPVSAPTSLPVSSVRRIIADRMTQSLREAAQVTLMRRVDASRLTALRNRWKLRLQPGPAPSFTDLAAKLCAIAIAQHPLMGGRWEGDRIVLPASMDIGVAVDTEQGLLVPVVRRVNQLSLEEVAAQSRALIEGARKRTLASADLTGSILTISNLGSFGVEAFTPILNYPETSVLGMGAIKWDAVVSPNGQIVAREQMTLSLTFDHRVVDGAPAARFLKTLAELFEEPPAAVYCP